MADRKQLLLKRFGLEWKIENYSSCVKYTQGLKSPEFQLQSPQSSWQLEVKVGDTYEIKVCLCRQYMEGGPPDIIAKFLLCLKTLHGPEIWRYNSGWLLFKKNSSFVSVPLILETDHTMVVTCVMLIMDQSEYSDPKVECLYRNIKSFSNDSGIQNTNAILVVGEQEKSIKVHKEMLSTHSTMFDDFYRCNDGEFAIQCHSPEVIVSILTFLYSGDCTLLAKDKNIFELLSCASALGFSSLIDTLRSESVVKTSKFELEDITYEWYYGNFNKTFGTSWTNHTARRIFSLHKLGFRMEFRAKMKVNMTTGQTLFCTKMWPLPAKSLCSSFFMEISVHDKNGNIHLVMVVPMTPDTENIYRLSIPIENRFLFGTDNVQCPRYVNFNFKIGAIFHKLT